MQKKINHLKIEVLIVTLIQLILIGTFLTLYLFNAWDMDKVVLPEHIAYFCSIIGILDCFYIWRILFAVIRIRKETDIRTSDIIGSDIQEAYLFGKLGFLVTDEDGTILWESEKLYQLTAGILRPQLARFLPPPDTQDAGTYRLALDMLCYAAFCTLDSLVVSRTPLNVETCARNMRALFVTMRQAS